MRLKRLIVQGFKSFVHSTSIDFAPALNVIVGPNGSGKSNVIDALRWVLGDHYREMRVSQNREVIFHGSPTAKPMGMAFIETEWIDESSNVFHISRKLFSSGESEYAFNHSRIRLKDLKNLVYQKGFPGETIGVNVVDNSKLQTLFDYRPTERYRLFEMSSGLYGMRQRLLRLDSQVKGVYEKLDRLRERIAEIELQERRVRKLAQDEQGFLELMSEVRELKRIYLEKAIVEREEQRVDLDQEIENSGHLITDLDQSLKNCSQAIQVTRKMREERQTEQETLETVLSRLNNERQAIEQELYSLVTRERRRSWIVYESREMLRRSDEESKRLEDKLSGFQNILQESDALDQEIENLRLDRHRLRDNERKASEELFRIQQNASVTIGLLQQNECEKTYLREEMTALETELQRTRQRIVQDSETLVILHQQQVQIQQHKEEVLEKILRVSRLVNRLEHKAGCYLRAGTMGEEWRLLAKTLNQAGWSSTSLYALAWLMKEKEVFPDNGSWPDDRDMEGSGQVLIHRKLLPPFQIWKVTSMSTIQDLFLNGKSPEDNLISPGGELIYLRSGFLHFPRKVLFTEYGSRFFKSFNRRREYWKLKQKTLEERVASVEGQLNEISRHIVRQEHEIERRQERADVLDHELGKKGDRFTILVEKGKQLDISYQDGTKAITQSESAVLLWREKDLQVENRLVERERQRLNQEKLKASKERFRSEIQHLKHGCEQAVESIRSVYHGMSASEKEFLDLIERFSSNGMSLDLGRGQLRDVQNWYRKMSDELEMLHRQYDHERNTSERAVKLRDQAIFTKEKILYEIQEHRRRMEELGPFADRRGNTKPEKDQRLLEQLIQQKEARLQTWNVRRGAIEEYNELKHRGDVLRTKIEGYQRGLNGFRKEFGECDREICQRFFCYVNKVNTLFARYFTRIFEGGEAGVALTGDGLEINIRIPGKRKQSLSLLSSGEKALCGLCLFLSLFRAGTFLFCFFDEVDANLDHFNSNRLAEVLREYANECQVVIVTHQEEVMEVADRIIGVTMAEPGVSRIVPLESSQDVERFDTGKD